MNEETQSRNTEGTIKIDDKEYVLVAIESSSDHKASYIPYMKVSRNAQLEFDCRNDFSSSDFTPSLFSALSMLFMIGFPTMMLPSIPGLERYSYASIIGAFLVSIVVISLLVYGISRACINSGIRKLDENEEAIFESFEKAGHRLLTPPFSYDRITAADCLPSGQIVSMVSKAIHPNIHAMCKKRFELVIPYLTEARPRLKAASSADSMLHTATSRKSMLSHLRSSRSPRSATAGMCSAAIS